VLCLAWLAQETLQAPIAGGEEDGRLGAAQRPAVALPNDQGAHILDVKEEGAQQSFDLFYPQLPSLNVKEETSTSVPVIHLPAEHEDDLEKVAADALLDMFPQDLLENNKKVRPVDVKIIEHDGYIDYEIEFVEIPDYYEYYDEETFETKLDTSSTTEKPTPEKTFVDLLKKARSKHRQQNYAEKESVVSSSVSDRASDIVEEETKTLEQDTENNVKGKGNRRQQNLGNPVQSQFEIEDRDIKPSSRRRSSTSARPDTDNNANIENDDDHDVAFPEITSTSTDESLTSTIFADSLQETPRSSQEKIEVLEKLTKDETTMVNEENHEKPTEEFEQFSDDFLVSESKSNLQVFTGEETIKNNSEDQSEQHEQTTTTTVTEHYDYDNDYQPSYTNSERVPKLISSDSSETQLVQDSLDDKEEQNVGGNYHEVNPGQYHEVNPGQYHEINPGQYHEVNPGQYHEVNPGQYHEENPGQYRVDDEDIQVSVDDNSEDDSRTYDVRANAGDFIIGEVGKIDINSGQTLEGVRYTALESEVNYEKIKEILEMYFGARTA